MLFQKQITDGSIEVLPSDWLPLATVSISISSNIMTNDEESSDPFLMLLAEVSPISWSIPNRQTQLRCCQVTCFHYNPCLCLISSPSISQYQWLAWSRISRIMTKCALQSSPPQWVTWLLSHQCLPSRIIWLIESRVQWLTIDCTLGRNRAEFIDQNLGVGTIQESTMLSTTENWLYSEPCSRLIYIYITDFGRVIGLHWEQHANKPWLVFWALLGQQPIHKLIFGEPSHILIIMNVINVRVQKMLLNLWWNDDRILLRYFKMQLFIMITHYHEFFKELLGLIL